MVPVRDFWSQDRTTIHQKSGWFERLPLLQRISYVLLLVFIICWCFYLGMAYAMAIAPEYTGVILDGTEWKPPLGEDELPPLELEGVEVVLLVGADKRDGETSYRTDTIILAFFNGETNELKLLSIPRDSYVQLPGKGTKTKINEAYFYGGVTLLENTIEYSFGIEVDHFVEMDFSAFLKVIDLLGGVEIDVPQRMYKPTEEINIQKGLQTLNGYDALGFVRFRDLPMGDIDRVANQQAFMRALAAKLSSELSIWKAPQLVNIAMEYTRSTYTLSEAMSLGSAILKSDLNNIAMYTLPGEGLYINGISYWVLYKNKCMAMITEITGGEVGELHIINDEGKGTEYPPAAKPKDEENPDGENPDIAPPDTEGGWTATPGGESAAGETPTEQPPAEQPPAGETPADGGEEQAPLIPVEPTPLAPAPETGGVQ